MQIIETRGMNEVMPYPKIKALYKRGDQKPHPVLIGQYTDPAIEYLQYLDWNWTEKLDGTNVRVHWNGYRVSFHGRTDNAQMPKELLAYLEETFGGEAVAQKFEEITGMTPMTLYGEGIGPKINRNRHQLTETRFVMFDALVGTYWLHHAAVESVAVKLGIEAVPIALTCEVGDALVRLGDYVSSVYGGEPEGFVGRPVVQLFDRQHNRIQVKLKRSDLMDVAP